MYRLGYKVHEGLQRGRQSVGGMQRDLDYLIRVCGRV